MQCRIKFALGSILANRSLFISTHFRSYVPIDSYCTLLRIVRNELTIITSVRLVFAVSLLRSLIRLVALSRSSLLSRLRDRLGARPPCYFRTDSEYTASPSHLVSITNSTETYQQPPNQSTAT
jgi:hypothetical protein